MTLTEVAQILSIMSSAIVVVVSLYSFARLVRRWWRSRIAAGEHAGGDTRPDGPRALP